MASTVVAIDLGASSGRVLAGTLSADRLEVAECSRFPNGPVRVPNGQAYDLEWDILFLWQGICAGLTEAARRGPIESIGIDSWAVDYGLLDADGRLMGNPSAYRSNRTEEAVESFHEQIGHEALYQLNGIQFQPFNTIYQLIADRSTTRGVNASSILMLPDLVAYWLTGERVCEVTNASTTGLIDPTTRTWAPDLIRALHDGCDVQVPDILPPLVEAGEIVGDVTLPGVDLQNSSHAPTKLVAVGSHDTASAVVAVPASTGVNFGFISSGTWSLVGTELSSPVLSQASQRANFTNELGADGTVRYLKNIMGMWVQQECLREWQESDMRNMSWKVLDAETENCEPFRTLIDMNDDVFLAPGDMLARIDQWACSHGEPIPRNRGEYLRTITDSLVVAYRRALREMQELTGERIDVIHLVGGGSKNRLLCQLTADATGLPLLAGPVEGTAIGNMAVQLRAIGAIEGGLNEIRTLIKKSVASVRYEPTAGEFSLWDSAERRVFG